MILNRVTELRHYHSQHRIQIKNLLDMERSHIKSFVDVVEEKFKQFDPGWQYVQSDLKPDEYECGDIHLSTDAEAELVSKVGYLEANVAQFLVCSLSLSLAFMSKFSAIFFQETALNKKFY